MALSSRRLEPARLGSTSRPRPLQVLPARDFRLFGPLPDGQLDKRLTKCERARNDLSLSLSQVALCKCSFAWLARAADSLRPVRQSIPIQFDPRRPSSGGRSRWSPARRPAHWLGALLWPSKGRDRLDRRYAGYVLVTSTKRHRSLCAGLAFRIGSQLAGNKHRSGLGRASAAAAATTR